MRLTPINLRAVYLVNNQRPKNGRRATRVPFPFNGCLPLTLKDRVSGKSDRQESESRIDFKFSFTKCYYHSLGHNFNDKLFYEYVHVNVCMYMCNENEEILKEINKINHKKNCKMVTWMNDGWQKYIP